MSPTQWFILFLPHQRCSAVFIHFSQFKINCYMLRMILSSFYFTDPMCVSRVQAKQTAKIQILGQTGLVILAYCIASALVGKTRRPIGTQPMDNEVKVGSILQLIQWKRIYIYVTLLQQHTVQLSKRLLKLPRVVAIGILLECTKNINGFNQLTCLKVYV